MPNLLVIQQLETLYLVGIMWGLCVKECEDLIKCVQSNSISRLELVTDLWVVTRQKCHSREACRKLKGHDS